MRSARQNRAVACRLMRSLEERLPVADSHSLRYTTALPPSASPSPPRIRSRRTLTRRMTHPTDTTLLELAELARLDVAGLGVEERAGLREALARTTEWVGQLMAVPTDGVPPTVQPMGLPTLLRADVAVPNADAAAVLALAPDREGDWYRLPRVVGRATAVEHAESGSDAAVGLEHGDE